MYYLRWGNTQSGPYESHQILQLAEQGMVNKLHEVVDSITSHSMTVEDFQEQMLSGKKVCVLDLDSRDHERERINRLQTQHDEILRLKQENERYAQQIRTISASVATQPLAVQPVYIVQPAPPRLEPRPPVQVLHPWYPPPPAPVMVHQQRVISNYTRDQSKSRALYIILALFVGTMGIHNFYAGRKNAALLQLLLFMFFSILAIPFLFLMNLYEIITIDKDGYGRPMY